MSRDECRPVEVDGELIHVRGEGEMDDTDRAMFAEVVRAAKRRFAAETLRACPDCEQGKHPNCLGETWDNAADDLAPCPCAEQGHPKEVPA